MLGIREISERHLVEVAEIGAVLGNADYRFVQNVPLN